MDKSILCPFLTHGVHARTYTWFRKVQDVDSVRPPTDRVLFHGRTTHLLQLQLQKHTLQQKGFVLRGVMQCKLVETSRSSALIGTAGNCCVVSECQVEVRSRPSEPQWRNFAGRWMCLPAKRTGHHGQPHEVTDVTNPRLGR